MASSLFLTIITLSDVSHIACGSLEAPDELGCFAAGLRKNGELVKHVGTAVSPVVLLVMMYVVE